MDNRKYPASWQSLPNDQPALNMMRQGLLSVTFRRLSPRDIVALAGKANLEGIEWGGDIHVPHGNLEVAREVGQMTRDNGLEVASYGSYYRAGTNDPDLSFEKVLETALTLRAPRIRIWAGRKGSVDATSEDRRRITADIARCASLAGSADLVVALEFHSGTLADTAESVIALFDDLPTDSLRLSWQPPVGQAKDEALQGLNLVLRWVDHIHVFHWIKTNEKPLRRPLAEGCKAWPSYFTALRKANLKGWAMLEFVQNDDPMQFLADAIQLSQWSQGVPKRPEA